MSHKPLNIMSYLLCHQRQQEQYGVLFREQGCTLKTPNAIKTLFTAHPHNPSIIKLMNNEWRGKKQQTNWTLKTLSVRQ